MHLQFYEKKHLSEIRPFLSECTVLLRSNGDFPLAEACDIDAFGGGVRHTVKGGTGSGEVNSRFYVTVEKGLEKSGFRITSKEWLDVYDEIKEDAKAQFIKEIKDRARKNHTLAINEGMGAVMTEPEYIIPFEKQADTAVYVLSRISGEGNDRLPGKGDYSLTDTEIRDILAINEMYERFMLVLNVGGPVDLSPVKTVPNILLLSQLGVDTGLILARILLGKMNPSGKLASTWAAADEIPSVGEFGETDDTRYKEGIFVGYRYFDSIGKKAMFPFGYGLSYTTFSIENAAASLSGQKVTVCAEVTNTGKYTGKETLELYVSAPEGRLAKPYQTLAAFAKTDNLEPGRSGNYELSFDISEIASYDKEKAAYILEAGDYVLCLGNSSVSTSVCGIVRIEEEITVRQLKNKLGRPDFEDWRPEVPAERDCEWDGEILFLEKDTISVENVSYDTEEKTEDIIASLTDEELAYMNIGAFNAKASGFSAIGSQAKKVSGAAGETTSLLEEKGIPVLVMADGPAGIRISREYLTDGKRFYNEMDVLPESMKDFMPKAAVFAMNLLKKKAPKDAVEKFQYCTAIPIGTAIAQSWNTEFAKVCGDVVGSEMQRFGVHLWLAPAMNIHRSPLCGRNFEYYSEDPLITGKIAAAMTLAVQSHDGCGVTIKHFAANNQETNRYQNNSAVSERAMREIYLRGYEICIREAKPCAVMTSYNLLNGIHTSERRDLIQDILRAEFGFDGIVMTDWIVRMLARKDAAYGFPHANRIAAAGGDLVMPGGKQDYTEIMEALSNGTLSRKQLVINASRVYRMAKRLVKEE